MHETTNVHPISTGGASRRVAAVAAAVLACGAGCAASGAQWEGTIEERDGAAWVTNPPQPLWGVDAGPELILEQTFGVDESPAEAMLARVRNLAVDDAGSVYVLDSSDGRLVKFDASGGVVWSASRPGQGPGELDSPRALAWDGDSMLYVANQSGARIDRWSTDGEWIDAHLLADLRLPNVSSLGVPRPDLLVLIDWFPNTDRIAHRIHLVTVGETWSASSEFEAVETADVRMPSGAGVYGSGHVVGDRLALGNVIDYEFRLYDLAEGRLERVVRRPDTGFFPAVIDIERNSVASAGEVAAPLWLPPGYWITQSGWPVGFDDPQEYMTRLRARGRIDRRSSLDLFDADGRFLASRVWEPPERPDFGRIMHVDADGFLYTAARDPYPQVRKYLVRLPGSES